MRILLFDTGPPSNRPCSGACSLWGPPLLAQNCGPSSPRRRRPSRSVRPAQGLFLLRFLLLLALLQLLLRKRVLDLGSSHGELNAIVLMLKCVGKDDDVVRPDAERFLHLRPHGWPPSGTAHLRNLRQPLTAGAVNRTTDEASISPRPRPGLRGRRLLLLLLLLLLLCCDGAGRNSEGDNGRGQARSEHWIT